MDRRAALLAAAATAGGLLTRLDLAQALEPAPQRPLLLVTGQIGERNTPEGAAFDLPMLQQLGAHSFSTRTPWYPTPRRFTGVPIGVLLQHLKARARSVEAEALNDYRAELPAEDWEQHGAMVAYLLDDQPMAVRDKGPLAIIYPFDDRPEARTAVHYGRAVWQLRRLDVR